MNAATMNEPWTSPPSPRMVDPHAAAGERTYATFQHLTILSVAVIGIPIVAALVMWLIKKDTSPFLDDHGRESVNFQISLLIYMILGGVLTLCGVGFILLVAVPILGVVGSIMAAVAANRGEYFRYPATIRLIP